MPRVSVSLRGCSPVDFPMSGRFRPQAGAARAARRGLSPIGALAVLLPATALAAPTPEALSACARIADPTQRLDCFDALVPPPANERSSLLAEAPVAPLPAPSVPPSSSAGSDPSGQPPVEAEAGLPPRTSPLGNRWAIGVSDVVFDIRPHHPTYILPVRRTDGTNDRPGSPTRPPGPVPLPLDQTEGKFQLSFKFKLADLEDEIGASLWAGYTQQSHWQVYNAERSRPFRETNYQPEVMLAFHPDVRLLGFDVRLLNVALVHQSNGRSEPLSRSWNRVYAQVGAERGRFALLARGWVRIKESSGEDDNPDITDYLGHGDVVASYAIGRHQLSVLGRYAFDTGHGGVEASWSFPLARRVRGYAQVFSGYGESLIDYNWKQTTVGVGISLADWF
jgi:phospholipase A1